MRLPNIESALIPPEKLRDYLLSPNHPIGRYKAAFFRSLGYEQDEWEALEHDIRSLLTGNAEEKDVTEYGTKYSILGSITEPNGRSTNHRVYMDYTHGRGCAEIRDGLS